jgi:N-acetylmuramoyl-L-alanine amidase
MRDGGHGVNVFHDNTSHSQSENLNTIVNHHNAQARDLDVSVHFNAYVETSSPMGTEVLYVTQSSLASKVSAAIASAAVLPNRGGKKRTDLFFLNETEEPSILIETCFVDSSTDAEHYGGHFDDICQAISSSITGQAAPPEQPDVPPVQPPAEVKVVDVQIYAPPGVRVDVSVNEKTEG